MNPLHITTFVFILYAISFFVAPKYIGFAQIPIDKHIGVLVPWNNNVSGGMTIFDKNSFMNETCYMWNTYPNISRIQFYLFMAAEGCEMRETDIHIKNIYAFLTAEVLIFMILSLLIFNAASSTRLFINLSVSLFLLMWIISIVFDIFGTFDYNTLNSFVYQNTYNVYGKVFPSKWISNASEKEMGVYFNDQATLIRQVCDMRNYFYYNGDTWFMTFKTCELSNHFLDTNKMVSIMLKSVSLFILIVTNIILKCDSYEVINE